MTTLANTQPKNGDDANAKASKCNRQIPAIIMIAIVGSIGVFMNIQLLELALKLRAKHQAWRPLRVAADYGACLNARHGLQRTMLESKSHDTTATERPLRFGMINNQQVYAWLEELNCSPLPAAAYEYRKPK